MFPNSGEQSVSISYTLRIEGTFTQSGDLLKIGNTTVTAEDVGKNIAIQYTSVAWFPPEASGVAGYYFTLDSDIVQDLFLSDPNAKIYIDNIIIRAA